MQVYKNRHGQVQWTLRRNPATGQNEWTRPGTEEVDSRPRAWQFEPGDRPLVNAGARPSPGDLKPSESLLRSLASGQREADDRARLARRSKLENLERGIEQGRVIVHPEARTDSENIIVQRGDGVMVVLPREKASERDIASTERARQEQLARAYESQRRAEADAESARAEEFKRAVASMPPEQIAAAQAQSHTPTPPISRPVAISEGHDPNLPKPPKPRGFESPQELLDPHTPGIRKGM